MGFTKRCNAALAVAVSTTFLLAFSTAITPTANAHALTSSDPPKWGMINGAGGNNLIDYIMDAPEQYAARLFKREPKKKKKKKVYQIHVKYYQ